MNESEFLTRWLWDTIRTRDASPEFVVLSELRRREIDGDETTPEPLVDPFHDDKVPSCGLRPLIRHYQFLESYDAIEAKLDAGETVVDVTGANHFRKVCR